MSMYNLCSVDKVNHLLECNVVHTSVDIDINETQDQSVVLLY